MTTKFSDVNNHNTLLAGGQAGLIVDHNFMIGAGGYGFSGTNKFDGLDSATDLYLGGYGGLIVGYTIAPKKIIHVSFSAFIGGDGFEVSDVNTKDFNVEPFDLSH